MSLQYAELKPVPLISYADAYALRATKATPILEQVSAMGNTLQESADKEAWRFVQERESRGSERRCWISRNSGAHVVIILHSMLRLLESPSGQPFQMMHHLVTWEHLK